MVMSQQGHPAWVWLCAPCINRIGGESREPLKSPNLGCSHGGLGDGCAELGFAWHQSVLNWTQTRIQAGLGSRNLHPGFWVVFGDVEGRICPKRRITSSECSSPPDPRVCWPHLWESRILQIFGGGIATPPLLPLHTKGSCRESLGDITASPAGSASQIGSLLCTTRVWVRRGGLQPVPLVSAHCKWWAQELGAGTKAHMPSSDAEGSLVCNVRNARPTHCLQGRLPSQALDLIWMWRDL